MARLTAVRSRRTKKRIWKLKPFQLYVTYRGYDNDLDILIGKTAVRPPRRRGRQDSGSGYNFLRNERDLSFEFATRRRRSRHKSESAAAQDQRTEDADLAEVTHEFEIEV